MKHILGVLTARLQRSWIIIMGTMGVLVVAGASPAAAAAGDKPAKLNGCTSVRILGPAIEFISDNIVNPVKVYGPWALGITIILAMLGSAISSRWGNEMWKRVAMWALLIVVGLNALAYLAGVSISGVCK